MRFSMLDKQSPEIKIYKIKKEIKYRIKDSVFSFIVINSIAIVSFGLCLTASTVQRLQHHFDIIMMILAYSFLLVSWINYTRKIFRLKKKLTFIEKVYNTFK